MKVLFWNDLPENGIILGPYSSALETDGEIRVPIDVDTMDDEAQRFFCDAHDFGVPLKNLLAVQQDGGTWELRELAGRWAYEVFENAEILENEC